MAELNICGRPECIADTQQHLALSCFLGDILHSCPTSTVDNIPLVLHRPGTWDIRRCPTIEFDGAPAETRSAD